MIPHVIRLSFWREDFSHLPFQQAEQRGKEAGIVILGFKDCLFFLFFINIFHLVFHINRVGFRVPQENKGDGWVPPGGAGERAASSK